MQKAWNLSEASWGNFYFDHARLKELPPLQARALHSSHDALLSVLHDSGACGAFLESLGNFSGPKSNIQTKV